MNSTPGGGGISSQDLLGVGGGEAEKETKRNGWKGEGKIMFTQNDFPMRNQDDVRYGLAHDKALYLACFWPLMLFHNWDE